jgi:hypothetical protein
MITKELVKAEVEKVRDDYLEVLYKIIKAFEAPPQMAIVFDAPQPKTARKDGELNWHAFIVQTYGCLTDDPITRGEQGKYEIREAIQ